MVSPRETEAPQSQFHSCGALLASDEAAQLPPSNLEIPAGNHGPPALAMKKSTFWPNGTHIKVAFMGNTPESKDASAFVKAKVQEKAKKWEKYANIVFDFVGMDKKPDIRVSFGPNTGSWSFLGTECRSIDVKKPTMNFGWFNDKTEDTEFERTAVHEFGHALGCTHELQSPSAKSIVWNKQAVYDYYKRTNGWDKAQVDAQVLTPNNANQNIFTKFDATSIMCYPIPKGLANVVVGWNLHLSSTDEDFISSVYPKQTHDAGFFSTDDLQKKIPPNNVNALQVEFDAPYQVAPKFAYGISSLSMSGQQNIRIATSLDNVSKDSFQVHADTWRDSQLSSAAVSWIEVTDDAKHQVGVFDTKDYATPEQPLPAAGVTQHVQFPKPFTSETTVLLFLKGFDFDKDHDWSLATAASNVSQSGFDISIKPGASNVQCFGAQVSWLAFPSYLPSICGGIVSTTKAQQSGHVKFPEGKYAQGAPPSRVMITLGGFDAKHGKDVKIKTYVDGVSEEGFTWYVQRWGAESAEFEKVDLAWVAA